MRARDIVHAIVDGGVGDHCLAFKLLGFLIYLAEEGPDAFLAGDVLSPRTYHRWMESLRRSGLDGLVLDARLRQLVREYVRCRFGGLPIDRARPKVLEAVGSMIGEGEAQPLQAIGRQAEPSALDAGAAGGRLRVAAALSPEVAK